MARIVHQRSDVIFATMHEVRQKASMKVLVFRNWPRKKMDCMASVRPIHQMMRRDILGDFTRWMLTSIQVQEDRESMLMPIRTQSKGVISVKSISEGRVSCNEC